MPTLSTQRETQTIELPVSGGEVTMYKKVKPIDFDGIDPKNPKQMSPTELVAMITQGWNFTDEDGNELEPTNKHVGFLEMKDFLAIVNSADFSAFLDEDSPQIES